MKFEVGDVVQLKSNWQPMTVEKTYELDGLDPRTVHCVWLSNKGKYYCHEFNPLVLQKIEPQD